MRKGLERREANTVLSSKVTYETGTVFGAGGRNRAKPGFPPGKCAQLYMDRTIVSVLQRRFHRYRAGLVCSGL